MMRKSTSDASFYDYFLWDIPTPCISDDRLQFITVNACRQYKSIQDTRCSAVFYPYSDLKNTIRIDRDRIRLRISDILRGAPEEILESLIHILIARAMRRKPQSQWLDTFNEYIQRPEVVANHKKTRCARTRKTLSDPKGRRHDLNASFHRVNQQYFNGSLSQPKLSWSPKRSKRQLGYHDESLNLIVVSRHLDSRSVPEFIVDYIMYHELLHTIIRPVIRNGKRLVHTPEFKRRERNFERFDEAIRWLGEMR